MQKQADRPDKSRKGLWKSGTSRIRPDHWFQRIWDLGSPGICNFEAMDYVAVDADVTMFSGQQPVEYPPDPCGRRRRVVYSGRLSLVSYEGYSEDVWGAGWYVKSIKNPYLNKLAAGYYVDDPAFCQGISVPQCGEERPSWICGRSVRAYLKRVVKNGIISAGFV